MLAIIVFMFWAPVTRPDPMVLDEVQEKGKVDMAEVK